MDERYFLGAIGWILGWILVGFVPRIPRRKAGADSPPIDVVIPARNEAHNIGKLLDGLAACRTADTRVIVVDDHSEDGTSEVASRYDFVELVQAPELPEGWTGKNWACHTGASHARQDCALVFIDADVRLHGDALASVVAYRQDVGGLVSVWPYHTVERPIEYMSAPFNVIAALGVGCGSLVPMRRPGALGPVLVTLRVDYDLQGGHEGVRAEVVDDYALGRRFGDAGLPVTVVGGHDDVTFRMYPGGLRELLEGWTKNAALGTRKMPVWRVLAFFGWLIAACGSLSWYHTALAPEALVQYGFFAVQMFLIFRQFGNFGVGTALLYPLLFVLAGLVFLRSFVHAYVFRRVTWRGRAIKTKAAS